MSSRERPGLRRAATVLAVSLALTGLAGCNRTPDAAPQPARPLAAGPPAPDRHSLPPWPAPTDVAARAATAGLDLGPMGTAEHYHPHLQVVIRGDGVEVPANIGVDPATGAMSALHTHEPDGTIHIEADTVGEVFTLGQLFTQWGVALTADRVGGVTGTTGQQVTVTSNGVPVPGPPADVRLAPDQRIVVELR